MDECKEMNSSEMKVTVIKVPFLIDEILLKLPVLTDIQYDFFIIAAARSLSLVDSTIGLEMVVICAAVKLLRPFVEFVRHGKMHFNSIRPVSISVCMKCKNININKCLCVSCATTFSNYYTAKSVRNNQQRNV